MGGEDELEAFLEDLEEGGVLSEGEAEAIEDCAEGDDEEDEDDDDDG